MENFQNFLQSWPAERRAQGVARATSDKVLAALNKDTLQPADFLPQPGSILKAWPARRMI